MMQKMIDLRMFRVANNGSRSIIYSLHRWNIYTDSKYLNCEEKMRRCHSMNFEDYSADKNFIKKVKTKKEKSQEIRADQVRLSDLFDDEDPALHMLIYG